ncbi:hypothetical protein J6590_098161 [Homalodisca vitripennis]|nr:hypothetical protein J6590_098161 [Homalodisca vitripennis]
MDDVTAGVLTTDLTDHYAVLAGVERRAPRVGTHTDSESGTNLDQQELHRLLDTQSWGHVFVQQDVHKCSF